MPMNQAKHIAHKNILWAHIKRFGALYGEDRDFLAEYAKDVYNAYTEDLKAAIQCFKDLIAQAERLPQRIREAGKTQNS